MAIYEIVIKLENGRILRKRITKKNDREAMADVLRLYKRHEKNNPVVDSAMRRIK